MHEVMRRKRPATAVGLRKSASRGIGRGVLGMGPTWEQPPTLRRVGEQAPVRALAPYAADFAQTITRRFSALVECITENERVIKNVAKVQVKTVDTLDSVQDSLHTMTASFKNLKTDVITAMKYMLDQHFVKKNCVTRPGPPQKALQSSTMIEVPEQMGRPSCAPQGSSSFRFQRSKLAEFRPHHWHADGCRRSQVESGRVMSSTTIQKYPA